MKRLSPTPRAGALPARLHHGERRLLIAAIALLIEAALCFRDNERWFNDRFDRD